MSIAFTYSALDIVGYVNNVTPTKISDNNNPYIDVTIYTEDKSCKNVKVMLNSATPRSLFLQKLESKSPIALNNCNSPKKSKVTFFNFATGSRLEDINNLNFLHEDQKD